MGEPRGFLVVPIGFNPSDDLRSLELDASDNLKVVMGDTSLSALLTELQAKLETADLELITSVLSSGPHGWIGGAWQKNPLMFGYSERLVKRLSNTSLPLGDTTLAEDNVPVGEIWVLTGVTILYIGTSPTFLQVALYDGTTYQLIFRQPSPVSNTLYDRQGWWVLKSGDSIRFSVIGATLNDDLFGYYFGFRVDIDQ